MEFRGCELQEPRGSRDARVHCTQIPDRKSRHSGLEIHPLKDQSGSFQQQGWAEYVYVPWKPKCRTRLGPKSVDFVTAHRLRPSSPLHRILPLDLNRWVE